MEVALCLCLLIFLLGLFTFSLLFLGLSINGQTGPAGACSQAYLHDKLVHRGGCIFMLVLNATHVRLS